MKSLNKHIEVTVVPNLSECDYIQLYSNNYGRLGRLQKNLHTSRHGQTLSNLLLFKPANKILGYALVVASDEGLKANYWVFDGERRRGVGRQLKDAVSLLYSVKHVEWDFEFINSQKL